MNKRNLLKSILLEAVKRNLEEMPQIKKFYTLADDWEEKAQGLSRLGGIKFQDVVLKLESMEDMNFFSSNDIQQVFRFKRIQQANNFVKILLQQGIIIPSDSSNVKKQNIVGNKDDEFSVTPSSDLDISQGIDLSSALSKIKIEKGIRKIQFTITKSYKLDIPREEQRRLAVEYGSVKKGIEKEIGLTPTWKQGFENDFIYVEIHQYEPTPYQFLKPFLEKKYYKQIPSGESVVFKKTRTYNQNFDILSLFPSLESFKKFTKENSIEMEIYPTYYKEVRRKLTERNIGLTLVSESSRILTF